MNQSFSDEVEDIYRENRYYESLRETNDDVHRIRFPYGPNPNAFLRTFLLSAFQFVLLFSYVWRYSKRSLHLYLSFALYLLNFLGMKRLNSSDPGTMPVDLHLTEYLQSSLPAKLININGVNILQKWCSKCRLYKPPRTNHCHSCNRCINRFDHHCTLLSNCIGYNNYKLFIGFVTFQMLLQHYSVITLYHLLQEMYGSFSIFSRDIYVFLVTNHFFFFVYFVVCLFLGAFFTFYNIFNKYMLVTNQTLHEFRSRTYEKNPYNEGIINNLKMFNSLPYQWF